MTKLFVDKTIDIHAAPERVWHVLTSPDETEEWASEFTAGGPQLRIESDWSLGSLVAWKDRRGHVLVEGEVTAVEPPRILRYTVFDTRTGRSPVAPEDGITYKLTERQGNTVLWISQGDFSTMPEGTKFRDLSADIWDRALTRIKRLAERGAAASR